MSAKVRLTESQLRRIIYEELIDHYLVQKQLWDEDPPAKERPKDDDRRPST